MSRDPYSRRIEEMKQALENEHRITSGFAARRHKPAHSQPLSRPAKPMLDASAMDGVRPGAYRGSAVHCLAAAHP
jgi:hypothetical protein